MKLSILKCHGSGNDFILIDETLEANSGIPDEKRSDLTRTVCRRDERDGSIGADGLLFYQFSETADCKMRMFNPDGGEAEMCGNGLRCVGRYCTERLMKRKVTVETMKAILAVKRGKPIHKGIETFEAEIGPVSMRTNSLPMSVDADCFQDGIIEELSPGLGFTALSVPNPHIVTFVDDIDELQVEKCGARANNSPLFPDGVNVSFVQSIGKSRIFVVTYERGVGVTYSCGTAMSASAYVSLVQGLSEAGKPISVYSRGGMVECDVNPDSGGNIILRGNATFVFEAEVEVEEDYKSIVRQFKGEIRSDEISAYGDFQDYAKSMIEK